MKITVVTVTLNAAAVVDAALASLREQVQVDIELVVVDGGSSDDTLERIRGYSDLRPMVIAGKDNGIYDAMNKGVQQASGDAIYFLNSDDCLAQPRALVLLMSALKAQADIGVVFGDVVVAGEGSDSYRSHCAVRPARLGYETLCHQAALVRRKVFHQVGGFNTNYRVCADLEWFLRCAKAGVGFVHVPRLVCRYAAGGESDRQVALRAVENRAILAAQRSASARMHQRLAAALRRRVRRIAAFAG